MLQTYHVTMTINKQILRCKEEIYMPQNFDEQKRFGQVVKAIKFQKRLLPLVSNDNLFIRWNNSQSEFLSHLKSRLHRDEGENIEEEKSQLCRGEAREIYAHKTFCEKANQ